MTCTDVTCVYATARCGEMSSNRAHVRKWPLLLTVAGWPAYPRYMLSVSQQRLAPADLLQAGVAAGAAVTEATSGVEIACTRFFVIPHTPCDTR